MDVLVFCFVELRIYKNRAERKAGRLDFYRFYSFFRGNWAAFFEGIGKQRPVAY